MHGAIASNLHRLQQNLPHPYFQEGGVIFRKPAVFLRKEALFTGKRRFFQEGGGFFEEKGPSLGEGN
jgi:hypothetical protein